MPRLNRACLAAWDGERSGAGTKGSVPRHKDTKGFGYCDLAYLFRGLPPVSSYGLSPFGGLRGSRDPRFSESRTPTPPRPSIFPGSPNYLDRAAGRTDSSRRRHPDWPKGRNGTRGFSRGGRSLAVVPSATFRQSPPGRLFSGMKVTSRGNLQPPNSTRRRQDLGKFDCFVRATEEHPKWMRPERHLRGN